jgi:hypothetical protein
VFSAYLVVGACYLSSKEIDNMARLKNKISKIDARSTDSDANNVLGA